MTSRNLDRTWREVVFAQYAADYEADVPFPVRYLINIPIIYGLPGRDVFIEIPVKIEVQTLKRALLSFHLATRHAGDPTYQDDNISVRPRKPARQTEGATLPEAEGDSGGTGVDEQLGSGDEEGRQHTAA